MGLSAALLDAMQLLLAAAEEYAVAECGGAAARCAARAALTALQLRQPAKEWLTLLDEPHRCPAAVVACDDFRDALVAARGCGYLDDDVAVNADHQKEEDDSRRFGCMAAATPLLPVLDDDGGSPILSWDGRRSDSGGTRVQAAEERGVSGSSSGHEARVAAMWAEALWRHVLEPGAPAVVAGSVGAVPMLPRYLADFCAALPLTPLLLTALADRVAAAAAVADSSGAHRLRSGFYSVLSQVCSRFPPHPLLPRTYQCRRLPMHRLLWLPACHRRRLPVLALFPG